MPNQESDAPDTIDAFFARLAERSPGFPKRLKQCADFVAANPDRVAVSTVAELSAEAGVQPSAFMRFCQELGFSGFSQMQRLFRSDYSRKWPDYATRIGSLRDHGSDSPAALLAEFVEVGRLSLENLLTSVETEALNEAVAMLAKAETIHLVGFRRAFPVTSYLAYAFEKMDIPAMLHTGIAGLGLEYAIRPGDAVLAVTFAPYTERTLEIAEAGRARGAGLVAITDYVTSPLVQLGATTLNVAEPDVGAFRALSGSLSLAISLAVSVGAARENGKNRK
ncbi:MurR/RpiR family transcriptional regulator [Martelella lutilitoris]|uniref:MurR/RpiR family transcriptional regulator n=1 Tax=Martelella lutilitoris TaxID=2583532 RepID=A0A5C4JPE5_9HYPH|nr:MurR/RpiR family transcriptional regulator [Martelella lutilitoris]TNB47335.1 MurR/RpiR family transcriptional regulator [Martelella lutilitoris]